MSQPNEIYTEHREADRQHTYYTYIYISIRHTFELYDRTPTKHTKHGTQTWHSYAHTKYTHTHIEVFYSHILNSRPRCRVSYDAWVMLDCWIASQTVDTIASRRHSVSACRRRRCLGFVILIGFVTYRCTHHKHKKRDEMSPTRYARVTTQKCNTRSK